MNTPNTYPFPHESLMSMARDRKLEPFKDKPQLHYYQVLHVWMNASYKSGFTLGTTQLGSSWILFSV